MEDRKPTALEEKWARQGETPEGDTPTADPAVKELEAQVAQLKDQLLRQQAELVNFRRRTERDRAELRASSRGEVLRELLPVLDDFERAIGAETENVDAYREGVELILRTLQDSFDRLGVTRIDPLGEPFDPNEHEAVEQQITSEVPAGHVAAVYGPGYRLGERLLRPASVAVAAAPAEHDASDD
jgi:molecular chaperone GrpE